jgi:hypothetical protein
MKLSRRLIGALLVLAACAALAGVALASKGSGPAHKLHTPARVHSVSTRQSTGEQQAENESESSVDQEAGQQGEPAQGHEDPPGQDVNHECTGDCQE